MRILFVDDDAMNRRVVRDMLQVAGVDLAEAESGEMGLQMVEAEDFDMVFMDLRMPGMDGLTAIRHIRARTDAKAGVPIVVVTADAAIDLRAQCLESGANDLILKPVAMDILYDTVGRVVAAAGDVIV